MCRCLEVSDSGYYAWLKSRSQPGPAAQRRGEVEEQAAEFHENSHQIYGYRKVHADLVDAGVACCLETVRQAMRRQNLRSRAQPKRRRCVCTTDSNHGDPIAPNVLNREFSAERPNQKWVTDITELPLKNGEKLYLAAVLDLFSRRVVGWALEATMETSLVRKAIENATTQRLRTGEGRGLLHHSDRGSQYASWTYRNLLLIQGMTISMSKKGDCWDNAAMESFFGSLKTEWTAYERMESEAEARQSIFNYIEIFYNRKRRHETLNYKTPLKVEEEYEDAQKRKGGA